MPWNKKSYLFLLSLAIFLFCFSRLNLVGSDISNSDAARWHRRSLNFLQAVKTGNLRETYQHYQPGVTLMLLNAPLNQAVASFQRYILRTTPKTLENADFYPVIHGLSKAQITLVLTALFLFQLYLIYGLFSSKAALFFAFLTALEPYFLGIDRWFHLTSLETYFSFSSFLALLYWRKVKKREFLYISGGLFALAVLAKLTSLILAPLILAVFVTEFLQKDDTHFTRKVRPIFIFALTFLSVFVIFFPAMWVSPFQVLQKLYNAVFNAVANDVRANLFTGLKNWFYYPIIMAFKLSPVTLVLFVLALFSRSTYKKNATWIFTAFVNFLFFLTLSDKKIDRYAVILFPWTLLLIANYLTTLKPKISFISISAALVSGYFFFLLYLPVNSAYYSPLFGGSFGALNFGVYENSGEYFAQAAQYLNIKGRNNTVWVPHNIEAFSYYYRGKTVRNFSQEVDFIVISLDIDRPDPRSFLGLPNTSGENPLIPVEYDLQVEKSFGDPYQDLVYVLKPQIL